jgi:transcriptional regulator with PAS, ATPase and Fis domain
VRWPAEHSSVEHVASIDAAAAYPSRSWRELCRWLPRAAASELPVIVRGESGTGKELVSRALHELSRRRNGPLVPVNCAALAESLLEAELFGVVRGAYTGADRDRPGLVRRAHGGTLFLDEVGDMPPGMQAKLLRVVESGHVRPVGGTEEAPADVRVVAATHRDLADLVAGGGFRSDLYYRLSVLEVRVPPLRERLEDLPRLIEDLTPCLCRETGCARLRIAPDAWRVLLEHPWPGNVRELRAVLARAVLRTSGDEVRAEHLAPLALPPPPRADGSRDRPPSLERTMIDAALHAAEGSVSRAAASIGWTRQKLYRRMAVLRVGSEHPQRRPSRARRGMDAGGCRQGSGG